MIQFFHALNAFGIGYCFWLYFNDPEKSKKLNGPIGTFVNADNTLVFAMQGNHVQASISAAFTALMAWFWYNNTGGGGLRNRFKNFKKALFFRTLPTPAQG